MNTIFKALVILGLHGQLVNHDLYVMVLVAICFHAAHNLFHLTIHTHIKISFLAHALKQFAIMTFALTY